MAGGQVGAAAGGPGPAPAPAGRGPRGGAGSRRAKSTPPPISSAISVVVASIAPDKSPGSASFSTDGPPTPVAGKTRQSHSSPSRRVTACTQGVVTPNIVRPSAGLVTA